MGKERKLSPTQQALMSVYAPNNNGVESRKDLFTSKGIFGADEEISKEQGRIDGSTSHRATVFEIRRAMNFEDVE